MFMGASRLEFEEGERGELEVGEVWSELEEEEEGRKEGRKEETIRFFWVNVVKIGCQEESFEGVVLLKVGSVNNEEEEEEEEEEEWEEYKIWESKPRWRRWRR